MDSRVMLWRSNLDKDHHVDREPVLFSSNLLHNTQTNNKHQGSYEEDERNAIAVLRVEEEEVERTSEDGKKKIVQENQAEETQWRTI